MTLSTTTLPLLLLMSMPVRLPVSLLLRISAKFPWLCTAMPALFRVGSTQVANALPARVMVNPSMTTFGAATVTVAPLPPAGPTR